MLVTVVEESGMFHKKSSPPCSFRIRAAAVGIAFRQPPASGGAHVWHSHHQTHTNTHTLCLITCTVSTQWPLTALAGLAALISCEWASQQQPLPTHSPRYVVVKREREKVSYCSCFSSDTSEGKRKRKGGGQGRKEEWRGEGLSGQGWRGGEWVPLEQSQCCHAFFN